MKHFLPLVFLVGCATAQEALPLTGGALEKGKAAYLEALEAKETLESAYYLVCVPVALPAIQPHCDKTRKALDKADYAVEEVRTALNAAIDVYTKINNEVSE